jgi:hypothetical protein
MNDEIEQTVRTYEAEHKVDSSYKQVAFYVYDESDENADIDWWNQCLTFDGVKVVETTSGIKVAMWLKTSEQQKAYEDALVALRRLNESY